MEKQMDQDPIVGHKFGRLTAVKCLNPEANQPSREYLCKCDCGKEKIAKYCFLSRGLVKSCGCLRGESLRATREKKWSRLYCDCRECRWHSIGKVFPVHICHAKRRNGTDYDVIPEEKIGKKRCMFFMSK